MDDTDLEPVDGLVIMALRIRDEECRKRVIHRLINNPGVRVTSTVFEFTTADWDEGSWEEELSWFCDALEGSTDSIIVWRFVRDRYSRFTIGEGR
jgi:hypothetical protein